MNSSHRFWVSAIVVVGALFAANRADAHFLWLKTDAADGQPQAVLIFGESPADEAYHLPESLADTKIWYRTPQGERVELVAEKVENDDRIGLVAALDEAKLPAGQPCVLETLREYGVYGDFLLTYYAKHIHADANDKLAAAGPSPELKLDLVPRAVSEPSPTGRGQGEGAEAQAPSPQPSPEGRGSMLEITALWDGKPKADVEVNVTIGEGETIKLKTGADGKVTLKPEGTGLIAVLANCTEADKKGKLNDKEYTSAMHYVTLTFPWSGQGQESRVEGRGPEKAKATSALPPLPEAVSSFGAAVSDGWLYVYSGHTGQEHDHSAANLSQKFSRVKLDGGKEWESLPLETPLQGLAVVAHGGRIYRVGGMNARNATTKDKEDLHSTTEFSAFDPATKKWMALAPLPDARSSHNAAAIGNKLYVTGGWTLSGPRDGEWLTDSLVYDFANPSAGWQKLPEQTFQRRALAAGQWQGKLVALGGMDENRKISQQVDLFDPQTGKWSRGPELPGAGMAGFGVSAWNLDGQLYVSGFRGEVFRLSNDGSEWEEVARLATPRFFHQLVPAGTAGALLAVGGATRDGHLTDLELIEVGESAAQAKSSDARPAHAADARSKSSGSAGI